MKTTLKSEASIQMNRLVSVMMYRAFPCCALKRMLSRVLDCSRFRGSLMQGVNIEAVPVLPRFWLINCQETYCSLMAAREEGSCKRCDVGWVK